MLFVEQTDGASLCVCHIPPATDASYATPGSGFLIRVGISKVSLREKLNLLLSIPFVDCFHVHCIPGAAGTRFNFQLFLDTNSNI